MKIIVAPNAFKSSLTALEAAQCISVGIRAVFPDAEIVSIPVADGGDGTAEVLVSGTGGYFVEVPGVIDPMGQVRRSRFGVLGDGQTAVIEMADASGLRLIPRNQLNPMIATSYGTGQLIAASLDQGFRRIMIGLGGSATVEGGAGMLQALGVGLLDSDGQPIAWGGNGLKTLATVTLDRVDERLQGTEIIVASDVENPLVGPTGAAAVFGPQKGATPEMIPVLDSALANLAAVVERTNGQSLADLPRGGAAGGLAAALKGVLNARLESGIDLVLETINLEGALAGAGLVITGEGKIDSQTIYGKGPIGVARLAKKHGIRVIALAGSISADVDVVFQYGIDGLMVIVNGPQGLDEAMKHAASLLTDATSRALQLMQIGWELKRG